MAQDKECHRIKIHYKGFPEEFDEWRDASDHPVVRLEKVFQPSSQSLYDRREIFLQALSRNVKRSLFSSEEESPEINLELPVDQDVYKETLASIGKTSQYGRNRSVTLVSNEELGTLLGQSWSERIENKNGDFSYVINGTVRYWMKSPSPTREFKLYGETFLESHLENAPMLVFTFVRGDGNLATYKSGSWKRSIHE